MALEIHASKVFNTLLSSARRDVPVGFRTNFIMCDGGGVGIDYDFHSVLFRQSKMAVAEIKAVGIGIQFHGHFFLAVLSVGLDVERVSVTAKQQSAGGWPISEVFGW